MLNKKINLGMNILFTAIICGSFALPSNSAIKKNKKSTTKSTVTPACTACLNSFDPQTLSFTVDADKCPKRLASCYKSNYADQCEYIITDCIKQNCKASGSCADEKGNRSLFAGCLKAVNQVLPYQCVEYIRGRASSKAQEVKALQKQQENALEEKKIAAQNAEAAAKQAEAQSAKEAAQIAANAQTKAAEIAADNQLKLEQEKFRLEQQAKDAELARQKKEQEDAKKNRPSVKYNTLLNEIKQCFANAKNYTTKAYNMLGITKTNDSQQAGSILFFPPQIITVPAIYNSDNNAKIRSLINNSRYKSEENFVCTKDTKENLVKKEIQNAYNTLKTTNDNLTKGISEIEIANDDSADSISDSKLNTLYQAQNKLQEIMENINSYISLLKTSCETRCAGISSMQDMMSTSSNAIEFDENGNIIEPKKTTDSKSSYSCKDFETTDTTNNNNDIMSALLANQKTNTSNFMGGSIGEKLTQLNHRVTNAVLQVDRLLDEASILAQLGKFAEEAVEYPAIDSCNQYMVGDIATYTNCLGNVLGQQLTVYSYNKTNENIKKELNESINKTIATIKSPNYSNYTAGLKLYCSDTTDIEKINLPITLSEFNDFHNCILSITNALNTIKDKKQTTGISNVIILGKVDNNSVTLNDYSVVNADGLAGKLSLNAKDCNFELRYTPTQQYIYPQYYGQSVPVQTNTNESLDMENSLLICTCNDNNNTRISIPFSHINLGSYNKTLCNTAQGGG